MHYVPFLGIFGLPVVAGVSMLVARALTAFTPAEPRGPGCLPKDDFQGTESHVSDLVNAFFAVSLEQNPKQ
jgi:hypothetical protein